jgi:hypothetical protein
MPQFMVFVSRSQRQLADCVQALQVYDVSHPIVIGNDINSLRELIMSAHKQNERCLYILFDGHKIGRGGLQTLLKLTEHMPHKHCLVMGVQSSSQLPDTVRSRAVCFECPRYLPEEIMEDYPGLDHFRNWVVERVEIPEDFDTAIVYGAAELRTKVLHYVDCIMDDTDRLFSYLPELKKDDEERGYSIELLDRLILAEMSKRLSIENAKACINYGRVLERFEARGANKVMEFLTANLKMEGND